MSTSDLEPSAAPGTSIRAVARVVLSLVCVLGVLAALLFVPAGRLDWVEAWAFIISYGLFLTLYALWGLLKDPGQLKERGQVAENVKSWDKAIMAAYTVFLLMTFVVSGLDAGRLHWSSVPLTARVIAWVGLAVGGSLIFWALATNTYLSRVARIQQDRGQVVVSSGPYRYVRHPMYLGIIILFICVPLALGSLWALIPGSVIGLLYIARTIKEDRMLREELPGYADYAQRVRYRIVPGFW
jgi:protein-S-isoprenylcysteine O-methyltransferase Ste14